MSLSLYSWAMALGELAKRAFCKCEFDRSGLENVSKECVLNGRRMEENGGEIFRRVEGMG